MLTLVLGADSQHNAVHHEIHKVSKTFFVSITVVLHSFKTELLESMASLICRLLVYLGLGGWEGHAGHVILTHTLTTTLLNDEYRAKTLSESESALLAKVCTRKTRNLTPGFSIFNYLGKNKKQNKLQNK